VFLFFIHFLLFFIALLSLALSGMNKDPICSNSSTSLECLHLLMTIQSRLPLTEHVKCSWYFMCTISQRYKVCIL